MEMLTYFEQTQIIIGKTVDANKEIAEQWAQGVVHMPETINN